MHPFGAPLSISTNVRWMGVCKLWGSSSSPSPPLFSSAGSSASVAAMERAKRDFTIYDGCDEGASEEELKVIHNTAKVKDGFPESGPTSVSDTRLLYCHISTLFFRY